MALLRIAKLTDYGIVLLATMARDRRPSWSASELTEATALPSATVAKVLKTMTKGGLLSSHRGKLGGYSLGRPAKSISLLEIVELMDGPVCLTECRGKSSHTCSISRGCPVRGHWRRINETVRRALMGLTLADMAEPLPRSAESGAALLRIAKR